MMHFGWITNDCVSFSFTTRLTKFQNRTRRKHRSRPIKTTPVPKIEHSKIASDFVYPPTLPPLVDIHLGIVDVVRPPIVEDRMATVELTEVRVDTAVGVVIRNGEQIVDIVIVLTEVHHAIADTVVMTANLIVGVYSGRGRLNFVPTFIFGIHGEEPKNEQIHNRGYDGQPEQDEYETECHIVRSLCQSVVPLQSDKITEPNCGQRYEAVIERIKVSPIFVVFKDGSTRDNNDHNDIGTDQHERCVRYLMGYRELEEMLEGLYCGCDNGIHSFTNTLEHNNT